MIAFMFMLGQWFTMPVDSPASGHQMWSCAIALDGLDNPHISYGDVCGNPQVKHAWWNGVSWITEPIDPINTIDGTTNTSITLDDSGHIYIAYRSNAGLNLARWDGLIWTREVVDPEGNTGWFCSIALDASGKPHISYMTDGVFIVKYARWTGSSWDIRAVDSTGGCISTSLAIDAQGYPHIAYVAAAGLKYASWNGSSWDKAVVDATMMPWWGTSTSLALDTLGLPHISYYHLDSIELRYAHHDGFSWTVENVDTTVQGIQVWNSIAVDGVGIPHIAYRARYGMTTDCMRYASRGVSSWDMEPINGSVYVEGNDGKNDRFLVIGADDCPRVAFAAGGTLNWLKYAHRGCPPLGVGEESNWGESLRFRTVGQRLYVFTRSEILASLEIYDASGRLVQSLHDGLLEPGEHIFAPEPATRGVYIALLRHPGGTQTLKLVR